MKVMKFGGTSVGTPERISCVLDIVAGSLRDENIAVVVSAFTGVTDQLIRMGTLAAQGDAGYRSLLVELEKRHLAAVGSLIPTAERKPVLTTVKHSLKELEEVLHGVFLVRELTARTLDFVMSFGERLSAFITAQAFCSRGIQAEFLDARDVLKTDPNFGAAHVNFAESYNNIRRRFKTHPALQVITGFIGSTSQNETTTLGRGGSDYSASLFGAALKATEIEIWTDVDGVLTADPRVVKDAFPIESMTYEEAMELSHFGAKVIHPPTMQPALKLNIPIRIRNTFMSSRKGTLISKNMSDNRHAVKGLSSISSVVLLRLQGSGMVGIPGIASRLFGALARKQISVILITQASSEHSICLAIDPKSAEAAKAAIEEEFSLEMQVEQIDPVVTEPDRCILAAIGENMRNTPGIAGKLFQALGQDRVNVIAIAQGSSELNVSIVVERKDEARGLNAIHRTFFDSGKRTVNLFLVGTGLIGGTLLRQIEKQQSTLAQEHSLDLRIAAIANSRQMLFDPPFPVWKTALGTRGEPSDLKVFVHKMNDLRLPGSIFADCTASDGVAALYAEILESEIAVVTPNKRAGSGKVKAYKKLKEAAHAGGVPFYYEATVGAGLPVIGTIHDLILSGDRILQIDAVLSGTLSFIFNTLSGDTPFSEAVRQAREKGYTEPNPAEDLNGMDVARKLLILSRELGLDLELRDIHLEPLLPLALRKPMGVEEFMARLKELDPAFEQKRLAAAKQGKKLQYMATLQDDKARISLQTVGPDHAFYSLSGSDNMVAFTTERYRKSALVVRGPGAGAEVTAAAVFADILRAADRR
jgi:aspartokinase/homoserine dehydrogenase 1